MKTNKRVAVLSDTTVAVKLYIRTKTGKMVKCTGEAHTNPFIDNCALCMPRWGEVEELAPVDLCAAKVGNFAVSLGELTDEQYATALKMGGKMVSVTAPLGRKSYRTFNAIQF
jgi:hypothetical protein